MNNIQKIASICALVGTLASCGREPSKAIEQHNAILHTYTYIDIDGNKKLDTVEYRGPAGNQTSKLGFEVTEEWIKEHMPPQVGVKYEFRYR